MESKWVRSHILAGNMNWEEAKDAFIHHYVDQDIAIDYQLQLEEIQRLPNELLSVFLDRYVAAMELAQRDPSQNDIQAVAHLLRRLPYNVTQSIRLIRVTNEEKANSVSKIVSICASLLVDTAVANSPRSPNHTNMQLKRTQVL